MCGTCGGYMEKTDDLDGYRIRCVACGRASEMVIDFSLFGHVRIAELMHLAPGSITQGGRSPHATIPRDAGAE